MNIEDLSSRLLVALAISIERGKVDPYIRDLAEITNISEPHIYRLLPKLKAEGLIVRRRKYRGCISELTVMGQSEASQIREYFRLP